MVQLVHRTMQRSGEAAAAEKSLLSHSRCVRTSPGNIPVDRCADLAVCGFLRLVAVEMSVTGFAKMNSIKKYENSLY
jgi:hypothetical protein